MKEIIEKAEKLVKDKFQDNEKRYEHTLGVASLAVQLAKLFNLDEEKIYLAALLHDYCKYDHKNTWFRLIDDDFIIYRYRKHPFMYHGFAAAAFLKNELNVNDEEIYHAIANHTVGRLNMSKFEEIIYISDYAEINRINESAKRVREVLFKNFYYALYLSYFYQILYLKNKNERPLELQEILMKYYYKKSKENKNGTTS